MSKLELYSNQIKNISSCENEIQMVSIDPKQIHVVKIKDVVDKEIINHLKMMEKASLEINLKSNE